MSQLRLYNQLHRRKEAFEPLEPDRVRIYSCGPTVYSRQHLGNMRPYVFADVLRRTLEWFGYEVKHVINITDVGHLTGDVADTGEDKMEAAARAGGESVWDVARRYTELFQQDLARLHVRAPALWSRATDHIPEQIAMIQALEAKGFAYRIADGIYFDVSRFPSYGELCAGTDLAAQCAQERIEAAAEKRNPADFALWKFSTPGGPRRQMEWDSPWGLGFPGWHIECSAMSAKHLGLPFDIHTGGVDHIPVHHTNEIAQTEAATGVHPCVRYWLHNGWLMLDGGKISKSKGHTINLDDLVEHGVEPLAYRYFLLGAVYRQQMNFNVEAIAGARTSFQRLRRHAEELRAAAESTGGGSADSAAAAPLRDRFQDALGDDLNTPQALAVVWEAVRSDSLSEADKWALLQRFDAVLALGLGAAEAVEGDARIEGLIREREAARKGRDFRRSDEIRDQLKAEGVLLEDRPDGTRWRRA